MAKVPVQKEKQRFEYLDYTWMISGILYQGGSEVTFDMPNITRYMFVAVQGVIILFSGALENLFRPQIESFFVNRLNRKVSV